MSLIVKICGLSTEETVDAALAAGADMVGFVFFPRSPRFVPIDRAATLAARARGRAAVVALAVDMDDAGLAGIVAAVEPDWLQLHGSETAERVARVREAFGRPVMKAVGVRAAADLAAAEAYAAVADRLLLDAKPPRGADRPGGPRRPRRRTHQAGVAPARPGGHGRPFDWTILSGFAPAVPWLLSGGLGPDNVGTALGTTAPAGVDVSSGVETAPGVKDPALICAFIAAARAAASEPRRLAS
jgi:phosphoribosylanthranilate isomerase